MGNEEILGSAVKNSVFHQLLINFIKFHLFLTKRTQWQDEEYVITQHRNYHKSQHILTESDLHTGTDMSDDDLNQINCFRKGINLQENFHLKTICLYLTLLFKNNLSI